MLPMNPYPRTWLEINLPALASNLRAIREAIGPDVQLGVVAKAEAYGHGLVPICRYAIQNGADWLLVATVQEGISLRNAGVESPIMVLSPILDLEAEQAVFYELRILVETIEIARALATAATRQQSTAKVHIPVDTGVSRFGVAPHEVGRLVTALTQMEGIFIEGIGTHFADSGFDSERTQAQMVEFGKAKQVAESLLERKLLTHVANSAGALNFPGARCDLVRVGIASYGIDPYQLLPPGALNPILTWRACVMAVRDRPADTWVSYAKTYRTQKPTKIATLGVGYGDGYPRSLSSVGKVWYRGHECTVIGLVCMDQLLIDVTETGAAVGELVELLGSNILATDLARLANTNSHEIVTRIMPRVPRRYIYD